MGVKVKSERRWLLLAALPLASGAALVVHVLSGISLELALLVAAIVVGASGAVAWANMPPAARAEAVRRVRSGLVAGALATIAYDASRWVTVTLFHDTFSPFDVVPIFGRAIAGASVATPTATAIGWVYHYGNGILFATAYALLLASRPWWAGILWALGLEALMLSIYPGWLHPHPFAEFVSVSMLGHVAYGSVLGTVTRWGMDRRNMRDYFESSVRWLRAGRGNG
jgi:hypothetical protein